MRTVRDKVLVVQTVTYGTHLTISVKASLSRLRVLADTLAFESSLRSIGTLRDPGRKGEHCAERKVDICGFGWPSPTNYTVVLASRNGREEADGSRGTRMLVHNLNGMDSSGLVNLLHV